MTTEDPMTIAFTIEGNSMTTEESIQQMRDFAARFSDVCEYDEKLKRVYSKVRTRVGSVVFFKTLIYYNADDAFLTHTSGKIVRINNLLNAATDGRTVWEVTNILGDDDGATVYGNPYGCPTGCDGNECDLPCPSSEKPKQKKSISEYPDKCPECDCAAYVSCIPGGTIDCSNPLCKYHKVK